MCLVVFFVFILLRFINLLGSISLYISLILEKFQAYFLKLFSEPPITCISDCLVLSHRSLILYALLFSLFSFYALFLNIARSELIHFNFEFYVLSDRFLKKCWTLFWKVVQLFRNSWTAFGWHIFKSSEDWSWVAFILGLV